MENYNQPDNLFNVQIDTDARQFLKTAAYWARILAIVGFVCLGLVGIIALFGLGTAANSPYGGGAAAAVGQLIMLVIMAAIFVPINIFLLRFANRTSASLDSLNQEVFNQGVNSLRTFFKIIGILVIIVLAIFVLAFVFGLLGALVGGR